jgi:hypothetical protein
MLGTALVSISDIGLIPPTSASAVVICFIYYLTIQLFK